MYLLMGDKYFPTKSERAMWIFNHLYSSVEAQTDLTEVWDVVQIIKLNGILFY